MMKPRARCRSTFYLAAFLTLALSESEAAAEPLSLPPQQLAVESLDALVLRYMARECRRPALGDTLFTDLPYDAVLTIASAFDEWGNPFVYNSPAILGSAQFDLYSIGPNGIDEKGAGDDVANWVLRRQISARWASFDALAVWSNAYAKGVALFRSPESAAKPASQEPQTSGSNADNADSNESPSLAPRIAAWILMFDLPVLALVWLLLRRRPASFFFGILVVVSSTGGHASGSEADSPHVAAIYLYTETQVSILESGVEDFRAWTCRHPSPSDTLALLAQAGLDSLATLGRARDYWGRPFIVRAPSLLPDEAVDIYSVGLNGEDEAGMGDDIGFKGNRQSLLHYYGADQTSEASSSTALDASPSGSESRAPRTSEHRLGMAAWIGVVGRWLSYLDLPLILVVLLVRQRRAQVLESD